LHEFFKWLRKIFENSVYKVFQAVRDIFFAFLAGILPKLPTPLRMGLAFIGVEEFLN
jgi:hypothetical protein